VILQQGAKAVTYRSISTVPVAERS